MREACCDLYREGVEAADTILRDVYRVEIEKALNPLHVKDYTKIVRKLAFELKGHAIPVEAKAVRAALQKLDVDWRNLSAEARQKVIDAAKAYLGSPVAAVVVPKIEQTLSFQAKDLIAKTKSKTVQTFGLKIEAHTNATDERVAKIVVGSQAHYVRDAFGKRRDAFGESAKKIVANGLTQGLGSADIAENLYLQLGAAMQRGQGYWNMLAMVFSNRARTMTQVFSFGEAGVTHYLWESVLDEVTSVQCRFLHGRKFAVGTAIHKIHAIEEADSPEAIKTIQPFLQLSGTNLYFGAGDTKTSVATVTENAVGQRDKTGSYARAMGDEDLEKAGIQMPPAHGHCRSTVIPEMG